MEGPGMSLFQGAGSIHINNSAQERLEEEEDREDAKRRAEELKKELDNAFDDIDDDVEASSVNSSANFTLEGQQLNGGHRIEINQPTHADYLKDQQQYQFKAPQLFLDTPKTHLAQPQHIYQDTCHSPCGAGDGHNNYFQDIKAQLNGINNLEANQNFVGNHNQLKEIELMYEMRVKECNDLALEMEKVRAEADKDVRELTARLLDAARDRDSAAMSLQQAQHLLENSKHQLVDRERAITELSEKLVASDCHKEKLVHELRASDLRLQEAQRQLQTMKVAHSHDTDTLFREQQDRHRQEVDRLHNDLVQVKNRLEEKENRVKLLERRCEEKEREKEELLIEKSGKINTLAAELESAQSRLASGDDRMKELKLASERDMARKQVKEFGTRLEATAHQLVILKDKHTALQEEYDKWRRTLHQILVETMPDNAYAGEPPSPTKLSTLKDVLSRYKQQLQKINMLQEDISKRDKKLDYHRKNEQELRAKIEEQKSIETHMASKVALLQNKLELLDSRGEGELLEHYRERERGVREAEEAARAECKQWELKFTELEMDYEKLKSERGDRTNLVQEANADLLKELEKYSAQLKDTLKQNVELKTLYLQACSSRDAVAREMKDVQSQLQREKDQQKNQDKDVVERLEKERQSNAKLREELVMCKEELERAKKRIIELQKELTEKQKDFTNKLDKYLQDEKLAMRKELESCLQCEKYLMTIRSLEEQIGKFSLKLATQGSNEELMQELKSKAEFFQNYIMERFQKIQEQRTVGTNTDADDTDHGSNVEERVITKCDDDDDLSVKTSIMMKEREIREQIAQKFTLEIKTVEMNCAKRIKEMENEHMNNVTKLKQLLENKAQEVETLKEFILSERANVQQILTAKENEISVLIKEHNALQQDYQNLKDKVGEYKQRIEKYQEKYRMVEEKCKSDKENSKKSIGEVEKEKQAMNLKLSQLESELQTLKAKYKNAKKTAYMYKEYITKKDEHVNGELNRIQNEYKDIFVKLQGQLNYLVNCRIQTTSSAQDPPDYAEMINRLQNDITALAQSRYDEPADWKGT